MNLAENNTISMKLYCLAIEAYYAKKIPIEGVKYTLKYSLSELIHNLEIVNPNNITFDKKIESLDKKRFLDDLIRLCLMYKDSLKRMCDDVNLNSPNYNEIYDRSLDITIFMAEKVIANTQLKKSSYDEIQIILDSKFYREYVENLYKQFQQKMGGFANMCEFLFSKK